MDRRAPEIIYLYNLLSTQFGNHWHITNIYTIAHLINKSFVQPIRSSGMSMKLCFLKSCSYELLSTITLWRHFKSIVWQFNIVKKQLVLKKIIYVILSFVLIVHFLLIILEIYFFLKSSTPSNSCNKNVCLTWKPT